MKFWKILVYIYTLKTPIQANPCQNTRHRNVNSCFIITITKQVMQRVGRPIVMPTVNKQIVMNLFLKTLKMMIKK